jgi:glyoxylase-like metal-dependent hydrolase (beta-lactamase superfamily II)
VWHVRGRTRDLLIDTGLGVEDLRPYIEDVFGRKVTAVIIHAHFDHCGSFHEFDERWMHAAEAHGLSAGLRWGAPCRNQMTPAVIDAIQGAGYKLPELLLDVWPRDDFDPRAYQARTTAPTLHLDEGHIIDLGNRHLTVFRRIAAPSTACRCAACSSCPCTWFMPGMIRASMAIA